MEKDEIKERDIRLQKINKLIEQGVDVFPSKFSKSHSIAGALKLKIGTKSIILAGRLMTIRTMGKLTFAHLLDDSGKMQIAFKQDTIGKEKYKSLTDLYMGDIIGIEGELFKTKKGEITIEVKSYQILAKAIMPLPEKWHGLKDVELKLRKRYLDLITNKDVKDLFVQRSKFIRNTRSYLEKQNFLEVETPSLEMVPGGAEAEPFTTHHNTLDIDFEIGKVFRNEGMSTQHLQEFTMLELYMAYNDYEDMMKFIEDFYTVIMKETFGNLNVEFQGNKIDFKKPWQRIDYVEIIQKKTGLDIIKASDDQIKAAIKKFKIKTDVKLGRGRLIDQLYKKMVRPEIINPSFLINLPVSVSPLAKRKKGNPEVAERLVVVAGGVEIGNGFSELNDPIDQKQRFNEQMKLRESGDKEAQMMDKDFIEALEYGMPPTAGFGIGLDRLFMVMSGCDSIRDVVLFPLMKEK